MCGIVGFIDFNKNSSIKVLNKMVDTLIHRGPDDKGYSFYEEQNYQIGLAHRRLSILDLSLNGHQPMKFDYLEIIHNGEVYNYKEIREDLEKYGYKFNSNTDTEVILKAFHKWGPKCVDRFIGMFAFAIYDKNNKKLYLMRDRAGVKPLYYYFYNGLFIFTSELKALHKHPDFKKDLSYDGLASFFRYGYITAPYSIFKNVFKLLPGHYLKFDLLKKEYQLFKFWDVYDYYNKPKLNISESEALEEIEKLLISSFNYRMISDVPVGVFLSGGYDSTAVTAILSKKLSYKLKTFTIGFNIKEYDESKYAKNYAKILETKHHEYIATEKDAMDIIPELSYIYDEPFGDSSSIPTILVSKIAKQQVSVALSADGADEIFGGYNKYYKVPKLYENFQKILRFRFLFFIMKNFINKSYIGKLIKIPNYQGKVNKFYDILNNPTLEYIFNRSSFYLRDEEIKSLINQEFSIYNDFDTMNRISDLNDYISKIQAIDFKTYLPDDILVKIDRATMSVSLEGREPFLDHRIIEFVSRLPIELKYKDHIPKYLLKKIVHKYIPEKLINRPKRGFSIPINHWYENKLKDYFEEYLNEKSINEVGILNNTFVKEITNRYKTGEKFLIKIIWYIFIFQQWAKKWLV